MRRRSTRTCWCGPVDSILSRGGPGSIAAAQVLHFAWPQSTPATVLSISDGRTSADVTPIVNVLDERPHEVHQVRGDDVVKAVLDEAKLGYGVLGVGVIGDQASGGLLSPMVDQILSGCDLPVVIVRRATGLATPLPGAFSRALVPVTGARASRAAQELACNLAEHLGTDIVLTHVIDRPDAANDRGDGTAQGRAGGGTTSRVVAEHVTGQAMALAEELGVAARTSIRASTSAAEEIVAAADEEEADVIIVGCTLRRLEQRPFLGHLVEHILQHAQATVVAVVLPPEHQREVEAKETRKRRL